MNLKLLKERSFSLLMLGKFLSIAGTQMQDFALSLYVLKRTGSATLFATVIIVALIPQLILSPIAGVFADWLDRKKIIIYLDMLSGIVVVGFAIIYLVIGELTLPLIYVLVILLTLASALYQPAINTVIPTIVKKDDLLEANSVSTIIMNMGNLIAPLLAGILFGLNGLFIILAINAFSFITAAIVEIFINIPKANKMPEKINLKVFKNDFAEGLNFIKERKLLLNIIILASLVNFIFSPLFSTGIIFITKKLLKVSDFQFGLMQTLIMASMILTPLISSKYTKKYSLGKLVFLGIFSCSLLIGIMAVIPSPFYLNLFRSNLVPYICITLLFFLIAAMTVTINIALGTLFQK